MADDLKLYEFQQNIRKKLTLGATEGLFFFIAGKKLDQLSNFLKKIKKFRVFFKILRSRTCITTQKMRMGICISLFRTLRSLVEGSAGYAN